MRAVQYRSYGGPDVLEIADAPDPHAGPGEIRIAVRGASVNPIDWKILSGALAQGPLEGVGYLGVDAAGVVDEVGEGVSAVAVGDEVFGIGQGTQAEYAVLGAWASKPASLDWAVAAAAGVAGETSERVLRLLDVRTGTVFIDGGAGGVGSVAVQMARARGLRVIASAGPNNQDYLREIGAVPVRYSEGLTDRVREAAGEGGVDGVFDVVGKTPIEDLISLVPRPGRVVSIANFGAAESGAQVTGGGADARPSEALAETAGLLEQSRIVVKVQTFPLDRAADAYQVSASGHGRGKLVLLP
jgi:NADPH:quinone reductase-like Zn-dependent oxidoreductase